MFDWKAAQRVVQLVSARWSLLVLAELSQRPRGYNALVEVTQLERRTLDRSLRQLEEAGLVRREVLNNRPLRVRYSVTDRAQSLVEPLRDLAAWWHHYGESS